MGNPERMMEMKSVQDKIHDEKINAGSAYKMFTQMESQAVQREDLLLDL